VRFLIVAVDGLLADTLPARTAALQSAAQSLGVSLDVPPQHDWIAGRGFAEAARAAVARSGVLDETLIDLLALAAERTLQQQAAQHAPLLMPDALARCMDSVADGWRVILRSDVSRRSAGPLLEHLLTALNAARAIAADDVRSVRADQSLVRQQYALLAPSWRSATHVRAVEASAPAYDAARIEVPALHIGWPTA
jgi:beta-phosphoglucomutase-like phosphatase (HAD superfamily)